MRSASPGIHVRMKQYTLSQAVRKGSWAGKFAVRLGLPGMGSEQPSVPSLLRNTQAETRSS